MDDGRTVTGTGVRDEFQKTRSRPARRRCGRFRASAVETIDRRTPAADRRLSRHRQADVGTHQFQIDKSRGERQMKNLDKDTTQERKLGDDETTPKQEISGAGQNAASASSVLLERL